MNMDEGIISLKLFKEARDKNSLRKLLKDTKVKEFCAFAYCKNDKRLENFISTYMNSLEVLPYSIFLGEIFIGVILLDICEQQVSYIISRKFRGKGLMKKALKVFIEQEIDNAGEVKFFIAKENTASRKVVEALGGVKKNCFDPRIFEYTIKKEGI